MKGYLWYNQESERYGIIDDMDCWADDGLHCGACMDAKIDNKWISVRLEYSNSEKYNLTHGWYLVGCDIKLDGINVKM